MRRPSQLALPVALVLGCISSGRETTTYPAGTSADLAAQSTGTPTTTGPHSETLAGPTTVGAVAEIARSQFTPLQIHRREATLLDG